MKTSHSKAVDWTKPDYRTSNWIPRKSIASKESKSKTVAIAVSPEQNIVALASVKDGKISLELRQYCYDPIPIVLHSVTVSCSCSLAMPLSLSFADGGGRLILLTGDVLFSFLILTNGRDIARCMHWTFGVDWHIV
jgi:hypothetical protein